MTERFVSTNLDLSRLPAPQVIKQIDYEAILVAAIADLAARFRAAGLNLDTTTLETEPAVILLQAGAYRETLVRAAINDAARSCLVAFATGGDLEHLGAFYGVARLIIQPATADQPEVLEGDADLRQRIQLAPELLPYAGMTGGGYRALARKTAPEVKDVATIKRPGGRVDVVLLARAGDGTAQPGTVDRVYRAFQDDEATQLTDIVTVRSAAIMPYAVNLTLAVRAGPDPTVVRLTAEKAVKAYAADRHRVGAVVYAQMLEAAASVGGVEHAHVDVGDIDPGIGGAAYLSDIVTTVEIVG